MPFIIDLKNILRFLIFRLDFHQVTTSSHTNEKTKYLQYIWDDQNGAVYYKIKLYTIIYFSK